MKILITGMTGFVGSYLTEYLENKNKIEVFGTTFTNSTKDFKLIFPNYKRRLFQGDLKNKKFVDQTLKKIKPDTVIHLAALSVPSDSWGVAEATLTNNMLSQLNILDSLKGLNKKTKILIISSGQVYGSVSPKEIPLTEKSSLKPDNPYAVSKLFQEILGYQYFNNYDLPVITLRPLNHIGPRQEGNFAIPSFVKQIIDIEKGFKKPIIEVGNLNAQRDFTDVRDICRAYILAVNKCKPGEVYNIAAGKVYRMREILDILLKNSQVKIKVKINKNLFRPVDTPILTADYSKFKKVTGWQPKISLEQTLKDTLKYWRNKK